MFTPRMLRAVALAGAALAAPWPADAADLIDAADATGQFETLLGAIDAAGLTEALRSDGPFTLFAPSDEAFRKLPDGTVDWLLEPDNRDQLVALLSYHLVPGEVRTAALDGRSVGVATFQGSPLMVDATSAEIKVDEATVVASDITADNGVIHVIDRVIAPPYARPQ